jgi:predicted site-specific integrase-resolvase
MNNFYRVIEISKIFKVKPITIRRWCRSGRIKAKKIGKNWYICEDDLFLPNNNYKNNNKTNKTVEVDSNINNL